MTAPEMIGDYALLERIAIGGMAEIYLAKRTGPGLFEKTVVIKRLLPALAGDEKFTQMFLDEARLAARLSHTNIVQIYDLGRHEDSYYIAMEYLVGEDLAGIIVQYIQRDETIDPWLAARIISQAAEGLHYAHTLTGADAEPLHIVHRDISPSNIIVTSQGITKLLDFGIAKAVGRVVKTETGVLKGKVAYMAPEQLAHQRIDHRADVYALGVTLFETLSCSRMFVGMGQYDLFRAVARGNLPPIRQRVPDLPERLEAVVERCLALNPDDRYPTAEALQRDLDELLVASGRVITHRDIARALEDLFGAGHFERLERRPHQRGSPSDLEETLEPTDITDVGATPPPYDSAEQTTIPLDDTLDENASPSPRERTDEHASSNTDATVIEGVTVAPRTRLERSAEGGRLDEVTESAEPTETEVDGWEVDPAPMAAEESTSTDVRFLDVSTADVRPPAAGGASSPPAHGAAIPLRRVLAAAGVGLVVLAVVIWATADPMPSTESMPSMDPLPSTANGPPAAPPPGGQSGEAVESPASAEQAGPDTVAGDGLVEAEPLDDSSLVVAPESEQEPVRMRRGDFGFLSLDSNVPLKIKAGKRQLGSTPLARVRLPTGATTLRLTNVDQGISRSLRVTIREGELTRESIRLRKGKLSIDVEPWANVYLGSLRLGTTPMIDEPIWEGTHMLRLENDALGLEKRVRVTIQPGKTTRVRESLR